MYVKIEDILAHSEDIGAKGRRLAELSSAGFNVPPFLVITAQDVADLHLGNGQLDEVRVAELSSQITTALPCGSYAVRSAALIEDQDGSSHAGQFHTELDARSVHMKDALTSVLLKAQQLVKLQEKAFSIIVQEYIAPDYAGILFTRSPLGGTHMVLEYRKGSGEKTVGGHAVNRIEFMYSRMQETPFEVPSFARLAHIAHDIENLYAFPQDIEWAIQKETIYILQSRPITSITPSSWKGLQLLDRELPAAGRYLYKKTTISETFATPSPLSFSLLKMLYRQGGPIQKAYATLGVKYEAREQFFLFGNELFVDMQSEAKTLFPSLGYLKHASGNIGFESSAHLFLTLKNILALSAVSLRHMRGTEAEIDAQIAAGMEHELSLEQSISLLLEKYSGIFTANILSQKALTSLERYLGKDKGRLLWLLTLLDQEEAEQVDGMPTLVGNSLNIDDMSLFQRLEVHSSKTKEDNASIIWWEHMPLWKKQALLPHIKTVQHAMKLREKARLLSVMLINQVRKSVEKEGSVLFPSSPELVYFATADELLSHRAEEKLCLQRRSEFEGYKSLAMPEYIASFVLKENRESNILAVSPGVGEGIFIQREDIGSLPPLSPKILVVEVLSPDLVQYFKDVKGIVSRSGGLLSHLAIMARESGVPVVVASKEVDITLGAKGRINGSLGTIEFD